MVGFSVFGWGLGMNLLPVMPENIEIIEEVFNERGIKFDRDLLYNHLSGYIIMTTGLGYVVGSILSGIFDNLYGYRWSQIILMLIAAAYGILYYVLTVKDGHFFTKK